MKGVLSILAAVLLTANIFGQATSQMSYQAEIRDRSNVLVSLNPVGMKVSILQGSETGTTGGDDYTAIVSASHLLNEPYALETTHYVGESYGGGIVFYVYEGGQHGLITAIVDDRTRKQRQTGTYADTIDFRGGIGAGKIITEHVITFKEARADDAQVFTDYQAGNYSDWYLPTRYDLNLLYLNRAVIGGYADFAKGWKSTEVSSLNTWFQSFITGARFTNGKDDAVYVRVFRKF